ncbi:NAD(P)/FAD-dependent oxidoreductase [Psychrobacter sp. I-STPA10]|uniref:NAD(P)/FAD-dependent oxidoreductase n=1 Tax=Psychrobacter sp. I-STPA10 TaxID=2585769 RepID=UPI001E4F0FE6|nr:FAD-binding oxidoreductase [Psychrobacter sp. I-STPA10]
MTAPKTKPVEAIQIKDAADLPKKTTVVIIGGGIVGLTAALTLAERDVPVVVLEKGRFVGEQSSRNLGWIRKTNRAPDDVPLAVESDKLWAKMNERVGSEVGYRQAGIMFLGKTDNDIAAYKGWLDAVESLELGSKLLTPAQIDELLPNGVGEWKGALYTPSDGYAEPQLAASAIANAAQKKGAILIENCAVRTLSTTAGRVSGVVTEHGEIQCDNVLLAAGAWSRRFLGNMGISFPTLPLYLSVFKTNPLPQISINTAVGAPNFSFRKHIDGGFIMMQRGALDAPLTIDHLKIGTQFLGALKHGKDVMHIRLNSVFLEDWKLGRRWTKEQITPFEKVRTLDPSPNQSFNQDALNNLKAAWPEFKDAEIENEWGGVIDVTPDSNPVIANITKVPGLTVAIGFSGHGFGTSPAAGQLAADLVMGTTPLIDPTPYCFERL